MIQTSLLLNMHVFFQTEPAQTSRLQQYGYL